jgi:hypothetical protein
MGPNHHHNDPRRGQNQDSLLRVLPKEGDFIVSASIPFTPSIVAVHMRSSLPTGVPLQRMSLGQPAELRRTVPPPPPLEEKGCLNVSTIAVTHGEVTPNTEGKAHDAERNPTHHERGTGEVATTTTVSPAHYHNHHHHHLRDEPASPVTANPPLTLAPLAPLEVQGPTDLADSEVLRMATSPVSVAGRLAYAADVTARVNRMRMRGRRTPEVALASALSIMILSVHGSLRSLNGAPPLQTKGGHLPQLSLSEPKRKKTSSVE